MTELESNPDYLRSHILSLCGLARLHQTHSRKPSVILFCNKREIAYPHPVNTRFPSAVES